MIAIVDVVWQGILLGLLLAIMLGPVFFALLQESLAFGLRSGIIMAIGITLSDAFYIVLAYFGLAPFAEQEFFKISLGLLGGLIMVVFGLIAIFKKYQLPTSLANSYNIRTQKSKSDISLFTKGFLLNLINPFVLIFWIGVSGKRLAFHSSFWLDGLFFGILLLTTFSCDCLKVYLSGRLASFLNPKSMSTMNRVAGVGLSVWGFRLIYFAIIEWKN